LLAVAEGVRARAVQLVDEASARVPEKMGEGLLGAVVE
jgi:hypothetical protein